VTSHLGALLAYTIGELASAWLAGTLKGAWLPHVWCIGHGILALESSVVGMWLTDTHIRFALTASIWSPTILAGEIVLGHVYATVSRLQGQLADIGVCRATTFSVSVLYRTIRFRRVEITTDQMVTRWLQALIFSTLTFAIGFLAVRCTLRSRGGVGHCEA